MTPRRLRSMALRVLCAAVIAAGTMGIRCEPTIDRGPAHPADGGDAACTPAECGPAPGAPNYPCDDGSVGGPFCGRGGDGDCGWLVRECPDEQRCGTIAGLGCPTGYYCDYALGDGCDVADGSGICRWKPEACIEIYDPVCGCDGKTYGNGCTAAAAGMSVRSEGECPSP